ncbi:C4-dicarboxylate ABC transporter permease [Terasakiispira papahanaumokuakeensis]|uniref:TRAP transporter small permease protein n=1 Tax=Terasakiispira papahanaumokuakeensis TaxID=197479 RepID=A0A1E2V6W1_9GAMM|nr:TRAP transporter small permease [Terasakiispira papahanaumokuakeensis]ODC02739.1 C4-dicarboxylate ABC transporter permease [Terasakiispira papahanaumokuakeensis]
MTAQPSIRPTSSDRVQGLGARVEAGLDGLAKVCIGSAGILLVFLVISFGWLVFGRYVLNDTPTWVEQLALVLIVYITCLGAAAGVRYRTHLSIDWLSQRLSGLVSRCVDALADLVVLVFGGFMCWEGGQMVASNTERMIPMLNVAESWRLLPLPVCGALLVIFSFARLLLGEREEAR